MQTIQCRQVRLLSNWKYFLVLGLHVLNAIAFAFARCRSICVLLTRNKCVSEYFWSCVCMQWTQLHLIAANSSSANCSKKVASFFQLSLLQFDFKERYPRVRRLLIRKWWEREYSRWRARRVHGKTQENLI